jgi:hypothetical protein
MGEVFSWGEVNLVYDRLRQIHDLNVDSLTKAEERGQFELQKETMEAVGGEIVIPVNCGQELYDVVEINDPKAGLNGVKRRIKGLRLSYCPREGRYEEKLLLMEV